VNLRLAALALLAVAGAAAQLRPAQEPPAPRALAIRDARVVVVSATPLERATVVVRDGLIEAVGANIAVPPDAWEIDGAGLTVYPGFIDAMSGLGLPPSSSAGNTGGLSSGPESRPATTPWLDAADAVSARPEEIARWRDGGFTTLAAAPGVGIFPGSVSLLNLGAGPVARQTVEPRAATVVRLPSDTEGYRGFPGALLGRIAYVRQLFLDASRAAEARAIYAEDPSGLRRPEYDRAAAAMAESLAASRPVLYPGDSAVELRRAIELTPALGDRVVVYGGRGAWEEGVAAEVAEAGLAVLVDVAWPAAHPGADPEADTPLRVLEHRRHAPSAPAALASAGVRFAFYSSGGGGPRDLLDGARKAVEAGLDRDRAIRALTLDAAAIYGADRVLGSVETGKIANLAVFRGDPLAEKAKPAFVVVDGVRYEVAP
jgi:imidazolonepropionase-like amidohydrolase